MKHIILICHNDHLTSGSVGFIQQLFETEFSVEVVLGESNLYQIQTLSRIHPDAVIVLWQTEFLAPWLTAKGHKVLTFPMYDGCAHAPKSYFKILDNTYLFNFSKSIHQKSLLAKVVSYQLNWYPTVDNTPIVTNKKDRLFYWLRRPESSLSESSISAYFSPYIDGIHIHDRPDGYNLVSSISQTPNRFVNVSSWFEDKEELMTLIGESKYYIAPRETEGIGMAFLEAMSRGCIVFANRNSTHDQYIYDGHNGFLIDFESKNKKLIRKQIKRAFEIIATGKPIGENARLFIQNGARTWEAQSKKVLGTLSTVYKGEVSRTYNRTHRFIGYVLARSYYRKPELYFFLTKVVTTAGYFTDHRKKRFIKAFLIILKRMFRINKK